MHNTLPKIADNDLIYTYKERFFTGFAPCFQKGVLSLACCKGAKNGNGMRQSICKAIEAGNNVWLLSIASKDIIEKGHNFSGIHYAPGDAIYLAKISDTLTWMEYSTDSGYKLRKDSYYVLKDGRVDWKACIKKLHDTPEDKERDCGIGNCYSMGKTEEEIFTKEKQILISKEYYIFNNGHNIADNEKYKVLNVIRGFSCTKKENIDRPILLRDFLCDNADFYCCKGINPFDVVKEDRRSGCI